MSIFSLVREVVSSIVVMSLLFNLPGPAYAQLAAGLGNTTQVLSPVVVFQAPHLNGLNIHPENPFLFDFILDPGAEKIQGEALKTESERLVKYFLTAMTIPDKEAWVNLSPYEANRIIPDALGHTEMGKVMLEQDYLLKQLAASLTNPDTELGKKYWEQTAVRGQGKADQEAKQLNRVWIVPGQAEVAEQDGKVFVTGNRLKVMLEEDYDASKIPPPGLPHKGGGSEFDTNSLTRKGGSNSSTNSPPPVGGVRGGQEVFRELILPVLEKEVNEGKPFAPVRQIYNSAILAVWYKQALKESLLGKIYVNQQKIKGVEIRDVSFKNNVYQQYLEAFKKGAYNLIKEEEQNGEVIPRKYFSGGLHAIPAVVRTNGVVGSAAITASAQVITVQLDAEEKAVDRISVANTSVSHIKFKPVSSSSITPAQVVAKAKAHFLIRAKGVGTLSQESFRQLIQGISIPKRATKQKAAFKVFQEALQKWQDDPENEKLFWDLIKTFSDNFSDIVSIISQQNQSVNIRELHLWHRDVLGAAIKYLEAVGRIHHLLELSFMNENLLYDLMSDEYRDFPEFNESMRSAIIGQALQDMEAKSFEKPVRVLATHVLFPRIKEKSIPVLEDEGRAKGGYRDPVRNALSIRLREAIGRHAGRLSLWRDSIILKPDRGIILIPMGRGSVIVLRFVPDVSKYDTRAKKVFLIFENYGQEDVSFMQETLLPAVEEVLNATFPRRKPIDVHFKKIPSASSAVASTVAEVKTNNASAGVENLPAANPGGPVRRDYGGIDFDPSLMNLQIKRDGRGVPLPLPQQNLQNIHIDGVYPIIINIQPAVPANFPLLAKKAG